MKVLVGWFWDPEDTPSWRLAKFSMAGAFLLAAGVMAFIFLSPPQEGREVRKRERPVLKPRPAAKRSPRPAPVSGRITAAVEPSSEAEVAKAMDLTAARHHLGRLRMAVASANSVARESAEKALLRYGSGACDFLSKEASRERDPAVREAIKGLIVKLR